MSNACYIKVEVFIISILYIFLPSLKLFLLTVIFFFILRSCNSKSTQYRPYPGIMNHTQANNTVD